MTLPAYSCANEVAGGLLCPAPCGNCLSTDTPFVIAPRVIEADDFPLPAACPMRNEGDDICESCQ